MRVIAGKFKGRVLKMPRGIKIRPTSQKVKEALFCILGKELCGASFLELFAGSGNIGIEAKSRGAEKVFFVENNRMCVKTIESNLTRLRIPYNYGLRAQKIKKEASVTLIPLDVERALKMLYRRREKFDFVFLDPPYYQTQARKSPSTITLSDFRSGMAFILSYTTRNSLIKTCLYDILKPHSYVIAEHHKKQILPQQILRLRLMFTKSYGDTALSFYQKEGKG